MINAERSINIIIVYIRAITTILHLGDSVEEKEIIILWKQGLSKHKLAEIYKRRYNQHISLIRLEVKNRHAGKFISSYDALAIVERVILNNLKKEGK